MKLADSDWKWTRILVSSEKETPALTDWQKKKSNKILPQSAKTFPSTRMQQLLHIIQIFHTQNHFWLPKCFSQKQEDSPNFCIKGTSSSCVCSDCYNDLWMTYKRKWKLSNMKLWKEQLRPGSCKESEPVAMQYGVLLSFLPSKYCPRTHICATNGSYSTWFCCSQTFRGCHINEAD